MKQIIKVFYFLFCCLFFVSCDKAVIDPSQDMNRKEFTDFMNLKDPNKSSSPTLELSSKNTPPNISKLLVAPPPPPMGNGNLISFSVTEDVPLKDTLIELGRVADIDIEIDPEISGGIILKITNKPLDVIVNRIADLGGLKYTYSNNILRFEKDLPYTETYNVDFLIDNDVWGTIESALNDIISLNAPSNVGTEITSTTMPQQQMRTQSGRSGTYKIIINKPSSMITVYANEKTQKAVRNYIENVKINYASQVLIEAKVVEVVLNDEYKTGIDWSFTNETKGGLTMGYADGGYATSPGGISGNVTTAIFGGSLTAAINALQTFGMTKTISSPRVHAMNNQKADLKFISKLIYFSLEKDEETNNDNNNTVTTYTSTKQEEDVGVKLTIVPSIDLKNNEITLKVTPELKVKVGEVEDPTNDKNKVPIIQSRSVETSLKVKSGNILVIGGLMSEDTINNDTGIPYLSGIPWLGYLFKSVSRTVEIKETVIFIKATIIKPNGEVERYDRELYKKFGRDRDNY